MIKKILTLLMIISLVTLSFRVNLFGIYDISLSLIVLCFVIILHFNVIVKYKYLILSYLFINLYFWIVFLVYINEFNFVEYIKTYFQLNLSILVIFVAFIYKNQYIPNLRLVFQYSVYILCLFEFLQVAFAILFNNIDLYFLFDAISISTAVDIGRFEASNFLGYFRPMSFYHEPGYLATVLFLFFIVNKIKFNYRKINYILITGILMTMSAQVVLLLGIYYSLVYRKITPIFIIIGLLFFSNELYYMSRLNELTFPGTSGYIRYTEPFLYAYHYIQEYPFGIPLGGAEFTINNSLFLIFFYFGILAFPIYVFIILVTNIYFDKNGKYYLLGIFSILCMNGAFFTAESIFLFLLFHIFMSDRRKIVKVYEEEL